MKIRLVTQNPYKVEEARAFLKGSCVEVVHVKKTIHELQTKDMQKLVNDKVLKAFQKVGRPVFVEHTGLYLAGLKNFPGGLTQIFWDDLKANTFSRILGNLEATGATAKTVIAYCDAKDLHFFEGSIEGDIAPEPRGDRSFQWDCVFIPKGHNKTFAELGEEKNKISMRKLAFDKFREFLCKEPKQ